MNRLAVLLLALIAVAEARAGILPLPGVESMPEKLQEKLTSVLSEKIAQGYRPRTHHLNPDGSPKYSNRLLLESSPYLLQHAHNPVNWYPWGEEAFAAARQLNRPVLLSVGYSTCHWCHVMERESFEDEEIARAINEHYIAIKVDREERPDIDSIYMAAVQMLTGRGGWPMTAWLTPQGVPFYAGTYFPPRDGDRGAQVGFLTLLRVIQENYAKRPAEFAAYGRQINQALQRAMGAAAASSDIPGVEALDKAAAYYREHFDEFNGGLGVAPKFPSSLPVRFLLRYYRRSGERAFLDMASLTLEKMAAGGLFDQIGGGFHRYAVDAAWRIPHFEKMLYDNALLVSAYLEAYQASGRDDFAETARRVLDYAMHEMSAPQGGFYSATDADSRSPQGDFEEGRFYTWTPAEIDAALTPAQSRAVTAFYGITENGDFQGRSIPHRQATPAEVAEQLGMTPEGLEQTLSEAREKLYRQRSQRPAPLLDDKILTAWNGLMISAFAQGGLILNDERYTRRAVRGADFILKSMTIDGRLRRSYKDGRARHKAFLNDYACLIAALLDLNETTGEPRWLREAIALQSVLDQHYRDAANGGYYLTGDDHEGLLVREQPAYDNAEPSGNSVTLLNLLRLHEFTTDDRYRAKAEQLLRAFGARLETAPMERSTMLLGHDYYLDAAKEIVIVTPDSREQAEPFLEALRTRFLPNKILVVAAEGADLQAQSRLIPLLVGKTAQQGGATAYVCVQGLCQLPTTEVEKFAIQLRQRPAAEAAGP